MAHFPQNKGIFALFANISKSIHTPFKILVHAIECTRKGGTPMKETTPPKDPKKKLWIGYAVIIAILFACNLFLFPAMMQAKVKSVNYSTFLQMLENKQLSTVQIEDQQIYFVDNENNSYKTNAIAQDNNLVTRLEDAGVEFGTVYQSPTIWDSLLNLAFR